MERLRILIIGWILLSIGFIARLSDLMIVQGESYQKMASSVQERERSIKAARGNITDVNGVILAGNKPVSTISVIHNQVQDPEQVISLLSRTLNLDEKEVRKKVEKKSSREKIKSNVDCEISAVIRKENLPGIVIDDDYKRFYPYDSLGSSFLGFTGADNQGVVGLETYYDDLLKGNVGYIYTVTDARGRKLANQTERRENPRQGYNLTTSVDVNIETYATKLAEKVRIQKKAKSVRILVMNPQNGEILALASVPEYNLNDPFTLTEDYKHSAQKESDALNEMWRCKVVSDTYEPGSTFKIITATAAFEAGTLKESNRFYCPGYKVVEDRRIHCSSYVGHGSQDFRQGIMNSCNPVFMTVAEKMGKEALYQTFDDLGLNDRTGIDLSGEAKSITHNIENVGPVELATMSFGQSFQITPLELMRAVSCVINGGTLVTPHFGKYISDADGNIIAILRYPTKENVISQETGEKMKDLLHSVVSEGTGKNASIPGYSIGGKTATSEKLPRSEKRYISSFLGFAPAEHPTVMALVMIDEPQGVYYGGTIAAPVVKELFSNILPYLGIEQEVRDEKNKQETDQKSEEQQ